MTQQASRLNLLPRLKVLYTSETARGQICIPVVNWLLLLAVLALVVGFQDSGSLAAAYGLAVSSDFVIGSILLIVTVLAGGARSRLFLLLPLGLFFALELAFFAANLTPCGKNPPRVTDSLGSASAGRRGLSALRP